LCYAHISTEFYPLNSGSRLETGFFPIDPIFSLSCGPKILALTWQSSLPLYRHSFIDQARELFLQGVHLEQTGRLYEAGLEKPGIFFFFNPA
jgi:hypothetical protein